MTRLIIVDEQMRAKLGKDEPVMICTADGVVLGYFTPTTQPQQLKLGLPIGEEEITRRLADRTSPTYTTEEVIGYLRGLKKGQ